MITEDNVFRYVFEEQHVQDQAATENEVRLFLTVNAQHLMFYIEHAMMAPNHTVEGLIIASKKHMNSCAFRSSSSNHINTYGF